MQILPKTGKRKESNTMIDYKESIVEVSKVHGLILPDAEVEEINDALNALLDDYISEFQ